MATAARMALGDIIVTLGITIAATDSHFYSQITDSYRFNPMNLTPQDFSGFHGTNEHISIDNMVKAVQFHTSLMSSPR